MKWLLAAILLASCAGLSPQAQIDQALDKDHPLAALQAWNKDATPASPLPILDAGNAQCRALRKSVPKTSIYFAQFVERYCAVWEGTSPSRRPRPSQEGYRSLVVDNRITGLPPAFQKQIRRALQKQFEGTPWYNPRSARPLPLTLSGEFVLDHSRFPTEKVRGYGWKGDAPLVQSYDGWNHHQVLEFYTRGEVAFPVRTTVQHEAQAVRQGFEHHWDVPQIGLAPQSAGLEDPEKWIRTQAEILAKNFRHEADAAWDRQFCESLPRENTLIASGEAVHRCMLLHQDPPSPVDAWYEQFLGLNHAEAAALLAAPSPVAAKLARYRRK